MSETCVKWRWNRHDQRARDVSRAHPRRSPRVNRVNRVAPRYTLPRFTSVACRSEQLKKVELCDFVCCIFEVLTSVFYHGLRAARGRHGKP